MHTNRASQPLPGFVEYLQTHGKEPASTRILDLGCGKGRNALYLAGRGFRVTGVDFSERAVADSRARCMMVQHLAEFRVMDLAGEWSFDDGEFDAVIDCNTTVYIPEPERSHVVRESYHVLKQGGYYLFYGFAEQEQDHLARVRQKGFAVTHLTQEQVRTTFSAFTEISLTMVMTHDTIGGQDVDIPMWVGVYGRK